MTPRVAGGRDPSQGARRRQGRASSSTAGCAFLPFFLPQPGRHCSQPGCSACAQPGHSAGQADRCKVALRCTTLPVAEAGATCGKLHAIPQEAGTQSARSTAPRLQGRTLRRRAHGQRHLHHRARLPPSLSVKRAAAQRAWRHVRRSRRGRADLSLGTSCSRLSALRREAWDNCGDSPALPLLLPMLLLLLLCQDALRQALLLLLLLALRLQALLGMPRIHRRLQPSAGCRRERQHRV